LIYSQTGIRTFFTEDGGCFIANDSNSLYRFRYHTDPASPTPADGTLSKTQVSDYSDFLLK
ncbi:MAG: hypothetical protein WCB15_23995, partial [Desulfobacterales bacterium]